MLWSSSSRSNGFIRIMSALAFGANSPRSSPHPVIAMIGVLWGLFFQEGDQTDTTEQRHDQIRDDEIGSFLTSPQTPSTLQVHCMR